MHGNCFIEFCPECYQDYIRDFDVTEKVLNFYVWYDFETESLSCYLFKLRLHLESIQQDVIVKIVPN